MEYKNIIDFLFNKKEDEELFYLEDAEREKLKDKSSIIFDEIINFIDVQVHPKCREKLKELLHKYDDVETEYLRKECELLYKNGVSDGIQLILYGLSMK